MDKTSGKDMDRPEFQACLRTLQAGDMLHVHSIDRLTRSLQDLLVILEEMADRNITVKFYKENLIFSGESSPFQRLHLQIIGAVAEFERALIRERQREGIALAKQRGKYKGRKKRLTEEEINALVTRALKNKENVMGLARGSASRARRLTVTCNTHAAGARPVQPGCCLIWKTSSNMLDCHYYFNDAKRIDNRSQRRIISSTRPGCLNGLYPTETAPQLCIHGVSCLLQQPLPHLSISADGTPACGTRPDIREGREAYPVSSVPVPCTGGGTSPPCGRTTVRDRRG